MKGGLTLICVALAAAYETKKVVIVGQMDESGVEQITSLIMKEEADMIYTMGVVDAYDTMGEGQVMYKLNEAVGGLSKSPVMPTLYMYEETSCDADYRTESACYAEAEARKRVHFARYSGEIRNALRNRQDYVADINIDAKDGLQVVNSPAYVYKSGGVQYINAGVNPAYSDTIELGYRHMALNYETMEVPSTYSWLEKQDLDVPGIMIMSDVRSFYSAAAKAGIVKEFHDFIASKYIMAIFGGSKDKGYCHAKDDKLVENVPVYYVGPATAYGYYSLVVNGPQVNVTRVDKNGSRTELGLIGSDTTLSESCLNL